MSLSRREAGRAPHHRAIPRRMDSLSVVRVTFGDCRSPSRGAYVGAGAQAASGSTMAPMNRDEVLRILSDHRDDLRREYGVRSLALFGSAVRNEASGESDVDLLVEFDRPIGLFHLIATEQHLEDLLGAKVDLVLRRAVLPELKHRIFSEAVNAF